MERRLAITYAVSATATLCTACVAVATVSGGLFAQAAPSLNAGVKQVELVDDYIVVHSPTTTIAKAPQSALMQAIKVVPTDPPAPAPTDPPTTAAAPPAAEVQPPAPAPAPTRAPALASASSHPDATDPPTSEDQQPVVHQKPARNQPPTTDGTSDTVAPHVRHHSDDHPTDTTPGD